MASDNGGEYEEMEYLSEFREAFQSSTEQTYAQDEEDMIELTFTDWFGSAVDDDYDRVKVKDLVANYSKSEMACGLLVKEFGIFEGSKDLIVSFAQFGIRNGPILNRLVSGLARMSTILKKEKEEVRDGVVDDLDSVAVTDLLKAISQRYVKEVPILYDYTLGEWLRKQPGVTMLFDSSTITFTYNQDHVVCTVQDGVLTWSSNVVKFVSSMAGNRVQFLETDPYILYAIASFLGRYKVSRKGVDGKLALSYSERNQGTPKSVKQVLVLPLVGTEGDDKKSMGYAERVISKLLDYMPIQVINRGDKDLIPSIYEEIAKGTFVDQFSTSGKLLIRIACKVDRGLRMSAPVFNISTETLRDPEILAFVIKESKDNRFATADYLDACRSFRGSDSDIANTIFKDIHLGTWWLGRSLSTTIKWGYPMLDAREAGSLTASAIGCSSDEDHWSKPLELFDTVCKYDVEPKTNVLELDVTLEPTIQHTDVLFSDVYLKTPGSSSIGCEKDWESQRNVVKHLASIALKSKIDRFYVKVFPTIVDNMMSFSHVGEMMDQYGVQSFSIFDGGRHHNGELIFGFSYSNILGWYASSKHLKLLALLARTLSVRVLNANLRRNTRLVRGLNLPASDWPTVPVTCGGEVIKHGSVSYVPLEEYEFIEDGSGLMSYEIQKEPEFIQLRDQLVLPANPQSRTSRRNKRKKNKK